MRWMYIRAVHVTGGMGEGECGRSGSLSFIFSRGATVPMKMSMWAAGMRT